MTSLRRPLACLVLSFAALAMPAQAQDEKPDASSLKPFGYDGRVGPLRDKFLKEGGGNDASEAITARGLKWLARVQSADGRWKLDGNFPDKGAANDVAGTGLGLLVFLGCGKTHVADENNPYDKAVNKGLKELLRTQNKQLGSFHFEMKTHAFAAMAMCEAYGLTKDASLKKSAQISLDRLVATQHSTGGWGRTTDKTPDMVTTGWAILALKAGMTAELDVPEGTLRKARIFLDGVNDQSTEGYGRTGAQPSAEMTAIGLLCRQNLQTWGPQNLRLIKGIDNYVKSKSPRWIRVDAECGFFAAQVMHHFGGVDGKTWNEGVRDVLVKTQDADEKNLAVAGSWSPQNDANRQVGGRLMVTALNLLTLETSYRQVPLYSKKVE